MNTFMKTHAWFLGGALLLGVLACSRVATPAVDDPTPSPQPKVQATTPTQGDRWQGVASCSTMGCHHASGARGEHRSEFTTWLNHDPHARAYDVLHNDQSATIVKNLKLAKKATEEVRCLNCHVRPDYDDRQHAPRFSKADGVGCESCHGPAEKWLTEHYRDGWKSLDAQAKQRAGLADTKSLTGRAAVCVACHVGKGTQQVDHDLIAAGHPRLRFDFAAYHANLPRHWDDRKDRDPKFDKRGRRDFEAQAWVVGQLVSARAALRLLEQRAEAATPPHLAPWPEFAEQDCYACHHDLRAQSWRQQRGFAGRTPGALAGSDWYTALLPVLADDPRSPALEQLKALTASLQHPRPHPRTVKDQAATLRAPLGPWLTTAEARAFDSAGVETLFLRVASSAQSRADLTWDGACQHYLGLAALRSAWRDLNPDRPLPPPLSQSFTDLASQLQFPERFDSPRDFTPDAFRKLLPSHPPGRK